MSPKLKFILNLDSLKFERYFFLIMKTICVFIQNLFIFLLAYLGYIKFISLKLIHGRKKTIILKLNFDNCNWIKKLINIKLTKDEIENVIFNWPKRNLLSILFVHLFKDFYYYKTIMFCLSSRFKIFKNLYFT